MKRVSNGPLSARAVLAIVIGIAAAALVIAPRSPSAAPMPHRTTDGAIALGNLNSQVEGAERARASQVDNISGSVQLVELLILRGRIAGRIGDYQRAEAVMQEARHRFPQAREAMLLQAKIDALFHRFDAALAAIDGAEAAGAASFKCAGMRASIYQALARYDEALAIREAQRHAFPSMTSVAALAGLHGERGDLEEAARLYEEARSLYRDVSPLPIASIYFDEGRMWMEAGQWQRARDRFERAVGMLPGFVPAQGHLAEVEAYLGEEETAAVTLRALLHVSDDPDYAAQLARITKEERVFGDAASRYDELVRHYPEAYSDHAAELWLARGDYHRALQLAQLNLRVRQTPRAYELAIRAAAGAGSMQVATLCADARPLFRYDPKLADLCSQQPDRL